jgi:hypothetical protein
MGSYGACLGLAGCGFYGHFSAEIAFFQGIQDWGRDEFYLLEPVGAVLLWCWGSVGCVDFCREGGGCACREAAEEESAAIRVRCFGCRHISPFLFGARFRL